MPERESKQSLVDLWELASGAERGDNPDVNVWELVSSCKDRPGYRSLWSHAKFRHRWIKRLAAQSVAHCHTLDGKPVPNDTIVAEFAAALYALGFVRGMQLGRELERDRKTKGVVGAILKHAPVRRLLLRGATAEEICSVLDDYDVELPKSLQGRGTWGRLLPTKPRIKNAIADAKKAAIQDAIFAEFLAVAKGLDDGDLSIVRQFRLKKFGYPQ